MTRSLHITLAAWNDLEQITDWIAEHDSLDNAVYVLSRLMKTTESVAAFPHRGSQVRELPPGLGSNFRQVFFKPYRIIYETTEDQVVVHIIVDGRRNLRSLLFRRLVCD